MGNSLNNGEGNGNSYSYDCELWNIKALVHRPYYFAGETVHLYIFVTSKVEFEAPELKIAYTVMEQWNFYFNGEVMDFKNKLLDSSATIFKGKKTLEPGDYYIKIEFQIPQECPGSFFSKETCMECKKERVRKDIVEHKVSIYSDHPIANSKKIEFPLQVNTKFRKPETIRLKLEKKKESLFMKPQIFSMTVHYEDVLFFDIPFEMHFIAEQVPKYRPFKGATVTIFLLKRDSLGIADEDFTKEVVYTKDFEPKPVEIEEIDKKIEKKAIENEVFTILLPSGKLYPTVKSKFVQWFYRIETKVFYEAKTKKYLKNSSDLLILGKMPVLNENFSTGNEEERKKRQDLLMLEDCPDQYHEEFQDL